MPINLLIDNCTEGNIIAADIFNKYGVKLVSSNTPINSYIIENLKNQGIEKIKVFEPSIVTKKDNKLVKVENNYKQSVTLVKDIIHDVSSGKKLSYDKVDEISETMYKHIEDVDNDFVLKCLREVRNADEYTYYHSINVGFYSMIIAKWLGLSQINIKQAVRSGFLHDIGKSKIPVSILNKPAQLTNDEFNIIKRHPIYGYFILNDSNFLDMDIKRAVLLHHERINRNGYPFSVSANNIGILTSIVSVSDVYDAMTSNRVYKKKVTPFAAFEMFMTIGNSFFDSYVTSIFVSHLAAYLTGCKVMLSNGIEGKIVYVPPENILSPVIFANGDYFNLTERKLKITELI